MRALAVVCILLAIAVAMPVEPASAQCSVSSGCTEIANITTFSPLIAARTRTKEVMRIRGAGVLCGAAVPLTQVSSCTNQMSVKLAQQACSRQLIKTRTRPRRAAVLAWLTRSSCQRE